MNMELLTALERIEREKGIDKEILFEAIESALVSAAKKVIDDPSISKEDIMVKINKESGEINIFSEGIEIQSQRFGRIAAQTAKQVIIQKIREAERDVVSDKYVKKVGTIISGSVHRFEKGNIIVEVDDAEAVVPKTEQIPREKFRQGEMIRAYLLKVERGSGAPEIILSRADAGFVKKLFELEVPEISQGIVEIKSIAREAGERTKIAVCSKDEKIDPVGACVGMRGSRVRDIVKELHGERIDIVKWNDDIREYLPAAVNPAEVTKMVLIGKRVLSH
ncbi:MAG: transcription termination factor NusA [Candidatus Omnitrophica bacterium]|nr:transcription termination factor NusA [Candidatus Omnitrophota bacterium]